MSESYRQSRLTMFSYILLKQEIEFNKYTTEYTLRRKKYTTNKKKKTDKEIFDYLLKDIHKLILDLKLKCNYVQYKENNKTTYFYVISKHKVKLNIQHIQKNVRKKYMYEIIYLYLIGSKYLNLKVLNDIFGGMKKDMFYQIRKELATVLPGELILNKKTGSYELNVYK